MRTYYRGPFVYTQTGSVAGSLNYISTPEGRIVNSGSNAAPVWKWEYNLTDHLGNVRAAITPDATRAGYSTWLQQTNYYPFGMKISSLSSALSTTNNDLLYNGKELQDDFGLNWYDYGARFYDPALGRFTTIDPKAETYSFQSPYAYAANNPIRYIDKNGKNPAIPIAIVGGVFITAADAFLISAGIITTGVILHQANNGSFEVNANVQSLIKSFSPGYHEQQKRERTQRQSLDKSQANVQKSIDKNIGKPSPDGTPDPKRELSTIGKILIGTGLAAETVKEFVENTTIPNSQQPQDQTSGSSNKEELHSATTESSDTKPVPAINFDFGQKEEQKITIPYRNE